MEFSIVAPLVLMVVFGVIDLGRAVESRNTIADAARQGTRQITANADSSPDPFAAYANQDCAGTVLTSNVVSNAGCLSDAALLHTVRSVMGSLAPPSNIVQRASCSGSPPAGDAWVCVSPVADCAGTCSASQPNCPSGSLPPAGTLGDRQTEWNPANGYAHKGCFLVNVSIVFTYPPLTPLLSGLVGTGMVLRASTSIVAEY